ncbi:hypothetical protein Ndes2526B_g02961 [Nannochloris sp. 'desiccata']|nr:hypothetical protein KSW81_006790 [Chlorella desiccata (nom. nud.)]
MFGSRADRRSAQELDRQVKAMTKLTCQACELVLVRHGETNFNVESRLQGQMFPGPALNDSGIKQAEALAARLAEEKFNAFYTSDLTRTLQTIDIVHKHHYNQTNLIIQRDTDLRERKLGQLEGKAMTEAKMTLPVVWLGLNTPNEASLQAGIEPLDTMLARITAALERIAASHPQQRVLVVTHGGVLHAVHRKATHTAPKGRSANCAINTIRIDCSQKPAVWAVVSWADDEHLDQDMAGGSFGGGNLG